MAGRAFRLSQNNHEIFEDDGHGLQNAQDPHTPIRRHVSAAAPGKSYFVRRAALFVGQSAEFAFDKEINFSVHDRLNVAGFDSGTMIFDHLIGLKDVRTDLISPRNIPFFPVLAIQFGSLSILFDLVDFRL